MLLCLSSCLEVAPGRGKAHYEHTRVGRRANTSAAEDQKSQKSESNAFDLVKRKNQRNQLTQAEAAFNSNPDDMNSLVWYGRNLAYSGQIEEAINVFTHGIAMFPNSSQPLVHRGAQFIRFTDFDAAIMDLEKATVFVEQETLEKVVDVRPNFYKRSLKNNKFITFQHMGIAFYLKGQFDRSISSFKKTLEFSDSSDLRVLSSYWLYSCYRKIGNEQAAETVVGEIPSRMRLLENRPYHDLIMFYRGLVSSQIVIERNSDQNNRLSPFVAYGVGNWYLLEGYLESANRVFNDIIDENLPTSLPYILAEMELALLSNNSPF